MTSDADARVHRAATHGRVTTWLVGAALVVGLASATAVADAASRDATPSSVAADVTVGLAFVMAGVLSPGATRERFLVSGVGIAWLLSLLVNAALFAYMAVLGVALVCFPTGRARDLPRMTLGALAIGLAAVSATDRPSLLWPMAALLFGAITVEAWLRARSVAAATTYPIVVGGGLAVMYGTFWWVEHGALARYSIAGWALAMDVALILVAVGFPFAMRSVAREHAALAERVLADARAAGLVGLQRMLAEALGDPRLRVVRWMPQTSTHVDPTGEPVTPPVPGLRWLPVDDPSGPLGAVIHDAPGMSEPATSAAVEEAVRLSIRNVRLLAGLQRQLEDLEAARGRLLTVTDRERMLAAERLQAEVLAPIGEAIEGLRDSDPARPARETSDARAIAEGELRAASALITRLVAGVPPADLGSGRIVDALRDLARSSPVDASVTADAAVRGSVLGETTLFYVCSEGLANAVKHGHARSIRIGLAVEGDDLVLVVADDGLGGARSSGAGIQGLMDRVAARGGRLRLDSPVGAGTTLTAWVPR